MSPSQLKFKGLSLSQIIPDSGRNRSRSATGFYEAVPVHAVKLFNAFPSNISSVALNREETSMSKLSVSFEYETFSTTTFNSGSANNFRDPINGGESFDVLSFVAGLF